MEMSSVLHKAQESKFSGCEGSLNFLKHFTLLSLKIQDCAQYFGFS